MPKSELLRNLESKFTVLEWLAQLLGVVSIDLPACRAQRACENLAKYRREGVSFRRGIASRRTGDDVYADSLRNVRENELLTMCLSCQCDQGTQISVIEA